MSNWAIRVEGIGKDYHITPCRAYKAFRDSLPTLGSLRARAANLLSGGKSASRESKTRFPALRNVSFDVQWGEVVGIIGRNGSGKSTLLKILSRITEPTCGAADIYGRVGALLEVGTGFNGELSGRENIFLQGAIHGMRRREIARKFDDIVAFAEVGEFIDTPVSRYSSGMYLRLGFAVAAFLESDILLVDEVLAVGDAAFQRKCLGKMNDVAQRGRTVLFVSHNLGVLANLCSRSILLSHGRKIADGPSAEVIRQYLQEGVENCGECLWQFPSEAPGRDTV